MRILSIPGFMLGILFFASAQANSEFPGRTSFPEIPVIEINQLHQNFDQYTIVDARSTYEYETLRIKGAHHVSLSSHDFADQVQALIEEHGKPIAFYCNGKTCYKSYEATLKARRNGIMDCVAFDAGVFDWVSAYPELGELLGQSPVNPDALISKESFQSHLLEPIEFADKADAGNVVVLDVRDRYQRDGIGFFPDVEDNVPLDNTEKLNEYIRMTKDKGRALLVYDEAGKQVRWLQYRLEQAGLDEYYFMEGGAKAFYNALILSSGYRYDPSN